MDRLPFERFWPSAVVLLAVVSVTLFADRQNDLVMRQEVREQVSRNVALARARLENRVESAVHQARGLAAGITIAKDLDSRGFSELVVREFRDAPELRHAVWAPDLVAELVYPPEDNATIIGQDYLQTRETRSQTEFIRRSGETLLTGPGELPSGGSGLSVHIPIYVDGDASGRFRGVVSVALDVPLLLELSGVPDPLGVTEFALSRDDSLGGQDQQFHGARDVLLDEPVLTPVRLPNGTWTLYGRPVGGWDVAPSGQTLQRFAILAIALLVIGPVFLANWLASARRSTITDLEQAETRLSVVLRNVPGAVFSYIMPSHQTLPGDGVGDRIEFINSESCQELWNVPAEEMSRDVELFWSAIDEPEAREGLKAELRRSCDEQNTWHYTWRARLTDETPRWLTGRGHPRHLSDGLICWDTLVVDVTDEVMRQEELEQQRELAVQAQKNESIGKMTGGVAHDFNNLLAVIMGNQELLREELEKQPDKNGELLEFVDNSLKATTRGADLTRKMLSFARRARLNPRVLDLNDVVRETGAWTARTLPETVQMNLELDDTIPQVRIDRNSAENALLNLIVNACDAMPDGGALTISTKEVFITSAQVEHPWGGVEPGGYVLLAVHDTGEGIPPEILEKVFEPFFTTKPTGAGSGLGLSMVHGFMNQSGGSVRICATVGVGTTVKLLFRASDCTERVGVSSQVTATQAVTQRARILVAEDEPSVRKVLTSILERAGYVISAASSGDAAFEMFKADTSFDLLLTDIVMPGQLQGISLARALRMIDPELPVVFMSGYNSEALVEDEGLSRGDARLMKPITRDDLLATLEAALKKGRTLG